MAGAARSSIFAAINLAICLPLNWLGLSRREAKEDTAAATAAATSPDGPVLEGRMRVVGIVLFALIMSLNGFVFGVISMQLVPLLEAAGLVGATAVWVASLKGHGQFAGRLVEIFFGRNLKAMTIARIAIGVVPASLILLFLARGDLWLLVAFTLLLGASQGVITIVRGAVPLALFGAKGYGAVLGVIATPILIVNAFSPAVFALLVDQFGWQISLYALLGCSMVTWIAIELMSRWYEGAQARTRVAVWRRGGMSARHKPLGGHPGVLAPPKLLAWASSYYLPAILADRIAQDLGMSSTWFFAAFSAALVVSAHGRPACRSHRRRHRRPRGARRLERHHCGRTSRSRLCAFATDAVAGLAHPGPRHGRSAFTTPRSRRSDGSTGWKPDRPSRASHLLAGFASTVGWPLTAWGAS